MINPTRLVEMARKSQKIAAVGRRRISLTRTDGGVVNKGHFVVYTTDERRFVIPLTYLKSNIFRELFQMSEEEFGLPGDGPITLPCDAVFMAYIISLVQRCVSKDVEKALLISVATWRCSASSLLSQGMIKQQKLLHGF